MTMKSRGRSSMTSSTSRRGTRRHPPPYCLSQNNNRRPIMNAFMLIVIILLGVSMTSTRTTTAFVVQPSKKVLEAQTSTTRSLISTAKPHSPFCFPRTTTSMPSYVSGERYFVSSSGLRAQAGDGNNNNNDDDGNVDMNDSSESPLLAANADGSPSHVVATTAKMKPQVFPQRWVQLGYLSVLALLSDWICFSVAAVPDTYEQAFAGHSAASLIDMFLFTNVASCFIVTDVVAKIGLQRAIQGAAALMAVGCWLRSGISFLPMIPGAEHLMSFPLVVVGTVLVGAAQPFFQCTPPLLSAQWFAASERATSTAIALNFNQIGIATAFLVGGSMATTRNGLENYFGLIAVLCTLTAVGSVLQFENEPPVPPSASEMEKKLSGHVEPPFVESVQKFFKTPGFTHALAAFVCSISITNVVGAFIDEVLERGGITDQLSIDLAGAGFELAILVGGIFIGGLVDRTKEYKRMTQICLGLTALLVIPLGLTEHAIGKEPILLLLSLLGLGFFSGPVQPINAELAVDVTYPGDETAVESVQQIGGNLISALLVPVAELAAKRDYQLLPNVQWAASDVRGDVVLLVTLAMLTINYFVSFDAPLARTLADTAADVTGASSSSEEIVVEEVGALEEDGEASSSVSPTSSRSDESSVSRESVR